MLVAKACPAASLAAGNPPSFDRKRTIRYGRGPVRNCCFVGFFFFSCVFVLMLVVFFVSIISKWVGGGKFPI